MFFIIIISHLQAVLVLTACYVLEIRDVNRNDVSRDIFFHMFTCKTQGLGSTQTRNNKKNCIYNKGRTLLLKVSS